MRCRIKPEFYPLVFLILLLAVILAIELSANDYAKRYYRKFGLSTLKNLNISAAAKRQPTAGQIFCWIATDHKFHQTRLPAVETTWAKRCDARHYLTNSEDDLPLSVPYHTVFRNLPPFYLSLFWKTHLALFYTYEYVSSSFDWYLKADDDTYVIIENLRKYLDTLDPSKPYYLGFRLKLLSPEHGYNAGAAYVLSNKAMQIFAQKLFGNSELCRFHQWEDLGLARCLASVSIYPHDTRDEEGRQRFFAFRPEEHLYGKLNDEWVFDNITTSSDIFHENVISFHHLTPQEIILAETLYSQRRHKEPTTQEDNGNQTDRSKTKPKFKHRIHGKFFHEGNLIEEPQRVSHFTPKSADQQSTRSQK